MPPSALPDKGIAIQSPLDTASHWFDRYGQQTRFGVLSALLLVPLAALVFLLGSQLQQDMRATRQELQGVEHLPPLRLMQAALQQHRGMSAIVLSGKDNHGVVEKRRTQKEAEIGTAIQQMNAVLARHQTSHATPLLWAEITQEWTTLKTAIHTLNHEESFNQHTALIAKLIHFTQQIASDTQLLQDPEFVTYHLANALINHLPILTERLGQTRAVGAVLISQKTLRRADELRISVLQSAVRYRLDEFEASVHHAYQANPDIQANTQGTLDNATLLVLFIEDMLNDQLLADRLVLRQSPEHFFNTVTEAIDSLYAVHDQLLPELELALQQRINRIKHTRNLMFLAVGIALFLLAFGYAAILRSLRNHTLALEASRAEISAQAEALARAIETRERLLAQNANQTRLASVGELATGIMHEINQPLTFISATTQTLRRSRKNGLPTDPEREMDLLKECTRQVSRITRILHHLRDFGQGERTEQAMPVALDYVIESALLLTEGKLVNQGIALNTQIAAHVPSVMGNGNAFEQVLINLIQNAMDALAALAPREQAAISISLDTVKDDHAKTWCELRVTDNGCGMPPEVQAKCFDPFFTTKEIGQGTGVGLSISYGIMQKYGGNIRVASTPGVGTTFTLRLPVPE